MFNFERCFCHHCRTIGLGSALLKQSNAMNRHECFGLVKTLQKPLTTVLDRPKNLSRSFKLKDFTIVSSKLPQQLFELCFSSHLNKHGETHIVLEVLRWKNFNYCSSGDRAPEIENYHLNFELSFSVCRVMPFTSFKKLPWAAADDDDDSIVSPDERDILSVYFFLCSHTHGATNWENFWLSHPSWWKMKKKRDKSVALKLTSSFFRLFSLSSHHLRHTVKQQKGPNGWKC